MIYAIVENGVVQNLVVAEEPIEGAIDVSDLDPRPEIGWLFSGGFFLSPESKPVVVISNPPDPIGLSNGMQVKILDGMLFVGCEQFDIPWAKQAIQDLFDNDAPSVGPVTATRLGVRYGEFSVSWSDCEKIAEFLRLL